MRHDHPSSRPRSRQRPEPFDAQLDDAADLTHAFWGAAPSWSQRAADDPSATGEVPVVRLRRAQLAARRAVRRMPEGRTRSHAAVEHRPAAPSDTFGRESTLGELAAGAHTHDLFDDLDPDRLPATSRHRTIAAARVDDRLSDRAPSTDRAPSRDRRPAPRDGADRLGRSHHERTPHTVHGDQSDWQVELDVDPRSPIAPLAKRLGLGAVDPLLLRLGVIVGVGVMLVPIALATRGDAQAVATAPVVSSPTAAIVEFAPAAEAAVVATAELSPASAAPAGAPTSEGAPSEAGDAATATQAAAPQQATAQQSSLTTSSNEHAVAESVDSATAKPVPAADGSADAPATVTEEADRLELECALTYVAGPGDSWFRIAEAAGISPSTLVDTNLAGYETPIFPGDEICLPAGAKMPSQPTLPPSTTAAPATTVPPTTVKATTTTAPATTVPAAPASTAEVQRLIREIWPDELEDKALQIAWRESNYKATAWNGHCCYGVFQIHWTAHKSWLDDYGIMSSSDLFDARKNITAAYALYQSAGGWGPWGG